MAYTRETHECSGPYTDPDTGEVNELLGCVHRVASTKPSLTGRHYCRLKACQAARARDYKRQRDGKPTQRDTRTWELRFVRDLVVLPRIPCPSCGLVNALPGWAHFDQSGNGCTGTRTEGDPRRIGGDFLSAAWPNPQYGEVQ